MSVSRSLDIHLIPRTEHSFTADDIPGLESWLASRGYDLIATRSDKEHARLRSAAGSIVILYHSGSVVVVGLCQPSALALLGQLVVEEVVPW